MLVHVCSGDDGDDAGVHDADPLPPGPGGAVPGEHPHRLLQGRRRQDPPQVHRSPPRGRGRRCTAAADKLDFDEQIHCNFWRDKNLTEHNQVSSTLLT